MLRQTRAGLTPVKWLVAIALSVIGLLLVLILFVVAIDSITVPSPVAYDHPECPHEPDSLTLPGAIAGVPEYHDCQQFITSGTYGPLIGIYARFGLANLSFPSVPVPGPLIQSVSNAGAPVLATTVTPGATATPLSPQILALLRASAIAVATIRNWGSTSYAPLGIAQGFNCLYVARWHTPTGLHGYIGLMIPVTSDNTCFNQAPANVGTWLRVTHTPPQAGRPFPPVSRWGWGRPQFTDPGAVDSANPGVLAGGQYAAILCGVDWCNVMGDQAIVPATVPNVTLTPPSSEIPWETAGLYDEQPLAISNAEGVLVPSSVVAMAVPHDHLKTYTDATFSGEFVPVAHTVLPSPLPQYDEKFNYGQGNVPGVTNQVFMCSGSRISCMGPFDAFLTVFWLRCPKSMDNRRWWARIVSTDGTAAYRCTIRRLHGEDPPAAARWRWRANDEGLWVRCSTGCCEVQD